MTDADALLAPFRAAPERSALLFDFDGTLSAIAPTPDAARPLPEVAATLAGLAERFGLVAAVSGRPVAFLAEHLPAAVTLSGIYGLEGRRDGRVVDRDGVAPWREVVGAAAERAVTEGPAGMRVEPKGLSLTVHYREHPELRAEVEAWATAEAERTGLVARAAKASVELHPPIEVDKGTVVEELADGFDAVLYAGDDVGDLPAFDALDRLEAQGRTVARLAVAGPEPAAEVVARADLVLPAPEDLLALLATLA